MLTIVVTFVILFDCYSEVLFDCSVFTVSSLFFICCDQMFQIIFAL